MKRLKHFIKRARYLKGTDFLTLTAVVIAFSILVASLATFVYAKNRKLVVIEVPVSTVKPEYRRGELVEGLFFGEVFYEGKVSFSRRLNCTNYTRILPEIGTGSKTVEGSSSPKVLKNVTGSIAYVPKDAPTDVNCLIEITNRYCVAYLFGCTERNYTYYTQNFEILSQPPRETEQPELPSQSIEVLDLGNQQPVADSGGSVTNNTTNNTTNNNTNNTTNNSEKDLLDLDAYGNCLFEERGLLGSVVAPLSCTGKL